jgi:hypothetical protein
LWPGPDNVTKFILACAEPFFENKTMTADFHDFLWQCDDSLKKDESNDGVKFLCHNSKDKPFNHEYWNSDIKISQPLSLLLF